MQPGQGVDFARFRRARHHVQGQRGRLEEILRSLWKDHLGAQAAGSFHEEAVALRLRAVHIKQRR